MTSELLKKIVLLKQKVQHVKDAPVWQKTNRAEAVIEEAVYIIEQLATEQVRLEQVLDDFVTTGGSSLNHG